MGSVGVLMGYKVGKGIDKYIQNMTNLALESEEITKRGVYDGMKVVADAIVAGIGGIKPGHGITEADIEGLRTGFGIARIENRGGTINTKSGFAGKNSKGKRNSVVAREIESGTSYRTKQSFVGTAGRQAKAAAEQAIAQTIDDEINKRMN